MNVPVYVLTSDKYLEALRPFSYLMNKYWRPNPQVIVGGFTAPTFDLPTNFHFHSLGRFEDYPVNRWSNALIKMLLELPHENFVLMLEDYWITKPVKSGYLDIIADYMKQFEYVARFDLTGDRFYSGYAKPYGKAGPIDLIISDPESQYHCSLIAGMWRRSHMLKILVEGETPWQVELEGTTRLRAISEYVIVLGTTDPPLSHTLALRGGNDSQLLLDELRKEDVAEMRRLGLLRRWEKTK